MSINLKKYYLSFKHLRDNFLDINASIQIHATSEKDVKYIKVELEKITLSINKILNKLKDNE